MSLGDVSCARLQTSWIIHEFKSGEPAADKWIEEIFWCFMKIISFDVKKAPTAAGYTVGWVMVSVELPLETRKLFTLEETTAE